MSNTSVCWQCGASLAALSLPFSRFDVCKACGSDLHVCRQCRFFAPTLARQCQEPIAEEVPDKHRNNVCDYFTPLVGAQQVGAFNKSAVESTDAARARLAALFGDKPAVTASDSKPDPVKQKADAAAAARAALDDLFGKKS